MKAVFMGTPDFSVKILEGMCAVTSVDFVITQPDRERGRGHKLQSPPVAEYAKSNNIPFYQPASVKSEEFISFLRDAAPDIIVTAAYGQIVPKEILDIPTYGCVNIHGSLLPKYRGASPVQQALINGDKVTGITLMKMDEKMDSGDVILMHPVEIEDNDNAETLMNKLADTGAVMIKDYLTALMMGKEISSYPQDHSLATYCKKIDKDSCKIDWSMPGEDIVNRIRAFSPAPCAFTFIKGTRCKVFGASCVKIEDNAAYTPGEIIKAHQDDLIVCSGDTTAVKIETIQPEGKRALKASEFMPGREISAGMRFE